MNKLGLTWWLQPPYDLEHKQYVLLAYIRDAKKCFETNRLEPYFDDVRAQIKNLECYSSIGGLLKRETDEFTKADKKYIEYMANLPDNHPDRVEIEKITKWAQKQLQDLQTNGNDVWKHIENSLAMSFIGKKPKKVTGGYLFVRHPGSWIVETYRFWMEKDKVMTDFIGLDENKVASYDDVVSKYNGVHEDYAYISVEPNKQFDTNTALMPVVKQIIKSKVITKALDSL